MDAQGQGGCGGGSGASARRHEQNGLWRSVLFMWYLRTLYAWGVSPAKLQQMYLDVR